VVAQFTNTDGSAPEAIVIQGTDGALYGTTYYGGSSHLGTVFRLNADGTGYITLHAFTTGQGDGAYRQQNYWRQVMDSFTAQHHLAATNGSGAGVVFRMNKDGDGFTLLHSFVVLMAMVHRQA